MTGGRGGAVSCLHSIRFDIYKMHRVSVLSVAHFPYLYTLTQSSEIC